MSLENYMADVAEVASANKVKIILSPSKKIRAGSVLCSGCFDIIPSPYLKVAIAKPLDKWLSIFVHEACHMEQWAEKSKVWRDYENPLNMVDYFDLWLSGKPVSNQTLRKAVKYIQRLELDCEKRTVDKIKKYKLPIDVIRYKRGANCYVYSYQYMLQSRKWVTSIYDTPYINKFPSVWKSNYTTLPESIKITFDTMLKNN